MRLCRHANVGRRIAIKKVKDTFMDVIDAKRILRELKLLRHLVCIIYSYPLNNCNLLMCCSRSVSHLRLKAYFNDNHLYT